MIDAAPGPLSTPDVVAWVSDDASTDGERVVHEMAAALRVHPAQSVMTWTMPGCSIALLAGDSIRNEELTPARGPRGEALWMMGEIFDWPSHARLEPPGRTLDTREALLTTLLDRGAEALADVDGEYSLLLWLPQQRALRVLNDRFASVQAYWLRTPCGTAVSSGVRGVLMAPGAEPRPDADALRQAVTFGGFRLGSRTNIDGVAMVPQAADLSVRADGVTVNRYWRWNQMHDGPRHADASALAELHGHWKKAVARRLVAARRPGLHLSGGLDSRAILAEAITHGSVDTITFGVPESDEVDFAARAARAAGVPWTLVPLFRDDDDWLSRREAFVQHTDGLIDLSDLKHLESLHVQARSFDVHLSGYIGDVVVGPHYNEIANIDGVLSALPFYGGELGMDEQTARRLLEDHATRLEGASLRFFVFEHKFPQSTNRWTAAWRPWIGVRKPFTAYAVFDFCQRLSVEARTRGMLRERWLRNAYPALFASIPDQRTGTPVLTPWPLRQLARAKRLARRKAAAAARLLGARPHPHYRDAAPDAFWTRPHTRERIEATLLRTDSLSCEIFGRSRVERVVHDYFTHRGAPIQVIGALFSFDAYHRDLPRHLRDARVLAAGGMLRTRQALA